MKGRFLRRNTVTRAMRAELADDLAQLGRPIAANDRACCCPARPMVTVVMPPTASRPYPIDLLLCGHHYRVSQAALRAAGATVYDQAGAAVTGDAAITSIPAASQLGQRRVRNRQAIRPERARRRGPRTPQPAGCPRARWPS